MRRILLNSIKGNEILARDIISDSGMVIISTGSIIKKGYVKKLQELNIDYVYVEDELSLGIYENDCVEIKIKDHCLNVVKSTIERYFYQGYGELTELKGVADEIIHDILKEPEVMFSICGIRNKSEATYAHSINVCVLSVLLAIRMKLPKGRIREIAIGSLLHDIGLTSIKFDYKNSLYHKLSRTEKSELLKHTVYGYTSIEKEGWLTTISKDIILNHHERLDGSGFPFRMSSDKIKLGSKIVAVCDEFDRYVYGFLVQKMKVHDTINYIISQAGVKFDFDVVNYFMESVAAYPNGSVVITNDGETGVVIKQNTKCPTRPVIHIIKDKDGKECDTWVEKDLKKELTLFIVDTIEC